VHAHDDSLATPYSFEDEVRDDVVPNEYSAAIVGITIDVGIAPGVVHWNGFE
jgi:hypothetical protein